MENSVKYPPIGSPHPCMLKIVPELEIICLNACVSRHCIIVSSLNIINAYICLLNPPPPPLMEAHTDVHTVSSQENLIFSKSVHKMATVKEKSCCKKLRYTRKLHSNTMSIAYAFQTYSFIILLPFSPLVVRNTYMAAQHNQTCPIPHAREAAWFNLRALLSPHTG